MNNIPLWVLVVTFLWQICIPDIHHPKNYKKSFKMTEGYSQQPMHSTQSMIWTKNRCKVHAAFTLHWFQHHGSFWLGSRTYTHFFLHSKQVWSCISWQLKTPPRHPFVTNFTHALKELLEIKKWARSVQSHNNNFCVKGWLNESMCS